MNHNIGQQIIVIYTWKIDGKGYIYLENQAFLNLNLRHWLISHLYWCSSRKYLSMFGFPLTNPSVNSQWYNVYKNMSALIWLRVVNHNFGLQLVQLNKVCLEYSGYTSHSLFHVHLVTSKSTKKWYLMCMCISRLCSFNIEQVSQNLIVIHLL